jgi:hypothetical protein
MSRELAAITRAAESLRSHEESTEAARAILTRRIYEAADTNHSKPVIAMAAGRSREWVSALLERRGR